MQEKLVKKLRELKLKDFTIIVPPSSFNDQSDLRFHIL